MLFFFRVDASFQIGSGHVMRCLTLAKALRDRGARCIFICREHEGHMVDKIRQEYFECIALAKISEIYRIHYYHGSVLAHEDWLETNWQNDAQETIKALGAARVDWLVVDHYALDKRWEEALRPYVQKIMAIDDLADRHHDCDLLLDQNLVANIDTRYQYLLPEHCATLLGQQYALLQPDYAELHPRTPPRTGAVKRIFVFFGAADQHNQTGRAVSAFLNMKRHDIYLDVVVNSNSPHGAEIQGLTQLHANIFVHDALPSLAPLMMQADLAIGGSGSTSWERCCLGLPTLVITLAENQKPIAAELHQRGLVRWLGHYDAVTDDILFEALQMAIDENSLESWSRACIGVTDGDGVKRVASVLALNSESKLQARLARLGDEDLLLRWVNDSLVRANAFNSETITAQTHQNWFFKRLRDPEYCKIYIVETEDGLPIGQVRFERIDGKWDIHYSLVSFARALGLAKKLLSTAIKSFRIGYSGEQVFGRVKQGNLPSQKVFEELGFAGSQGGGKLSIVICSDAGSWINNSIPELLLSLMSMDHTCVWVNNADDLDGGDICIYLSYGRIVSEERLSKFRNNLVVHASDLPKGRGWSPTSWMILEGQSQIPVTLIEALPKVDSGPIYDQIWIDLEHADLVDEWRIKLSRATVSLVQDFVRNYPVSLEGKRAQQGEPSFYPKRGRLDSQLDVGKPLIEQFNLLRIVDNESYPAFFDAYGSEFVLQVQKRTSTKH